MTDKTQIAELRKVIHSVQSTKLDIIQAAECVVGKLEAADKAFSTQFERAEAAEKERDRITREYKSVINQHMPLTSDGCDEGWSRVIEASELQVKLGAAQARIAELEGVVTRQKDTLVKYREDVSEAEAELAAIRGAAVPVFGWMRVVSGCSFQIMEGEQPPPDRSGNGAGPWFAVYRQPQQQPELGDSFDELASIIGFSKERLEQTGDSPMDCAKELLERTAKAEAELAAIRGAAVPVAWGTMQQDWPDEDRSLFLDKDIAESYSQNCYPLTPLFIHPAPPFDKKANIEAAHALSDVRRFIEAKFMTVADLPSAEGLLLKGPECKHEADAIIAALERVADWYENQPVPVVVLPTTYWTFDDDNNPVFDADEVIAALEKSGVAFKYAGCEMGG